MARLVHATCPRCGAHVPVEPDTDRATCSYCGAAAIVAKTEQVPAHVPVRAAPATRRTNAGCVIVVVLVVLVLGIAAAGWLLVSDSADPSAGPVSIAVAPVPSVPNMVPAVLPAPVPPAFAVWSGAPLVVLDVDGDRRLEVVSPVRSASSSTEHYAVFDARTLAKRTQTPPIEGLSRALVAGLGNRLVVATDAGQLTGYDLVSGDSQWSTALGERITMLCESDRAGSMHVETRDERKLTVDLTTGRQTETRDACGVLLARSDTPPRPRDRRDHSAPRGVEAWSCGGVTVMGSESYTVADACRTRGHVDTDRIEGMVGHRIWKQGAGWLVFGVRRPGTYVPMVARIERNALVWKTEVPASNPLDAEIGGPDLVVLVGDTLVVGYETGADDSQVLTAFLVADGTRRWTVPIAGGYGTPEMAALEDAVVVRTGDMLRVLAVADGAVRATLGTVE